MSNLHERCFCVLITEANKITGANAAGHLSGEAGRAWPPASLSFCVSRRSFMDRKRDFLNRLRPVCLRPGMYTVGGTVPELLAFIHGLECGMFPGRDDPSPLDQFNEWLAKAWSMPKE